MSTSLYSSPFLDPVAIKSSYKDYTESDLDSMLAEYRAASMKDDTQRQSETVSESPLVCCAGDRLLPPSLLKQSALYLDALILPNPLFRWTRPPRSLDTSMMEYMGRDWRMDRRESIAGASEYMLQVRPMVEAGFIRFKPISLVHEPPDEAPLLLSEDGFASLLPDSIRDLIVGQAEVYRVEIEADGHPILHPVTQPCVRIGIHFGSGAGGHLHLEQLFDQRVVRTEDATDGSKRVQLAMKLAEKPLDARGFESWLAQSVNKAARQEYDEVMKNTLVSMSLGASFITQRAFETLLLKRIGGATGTQDAGCASLEMQLDLPFLNDVDEVVLMDIRSKLPDAFRDFRAELESRLAPLRTLEDPAVLRTELNRISRDLTDRGLSGIQREVAQVSRRMALETAIGIVGFATSISVGVPPDLAAIGAMLAGVARYQAFQYSLRRNPLYFLWKVKEGGR
ncbi:MAG: hypothetical protein GX465_18835 [Acidobacteria bacterium]|nr:hypothetical protein [Acidobacteriota bacterium]